MKLAFILSMPGRASWNGRWSGQDELYCIIKSFTTKKAKANAEKILANQANFVHAFGDGWVARISVKEVDNAEARAMQKKSKGFWGYDWMVDQIFTYGRILTQQEMADLRNGKAPDVRKEATATAA